MALGRNIAVGLGASVFGAAISLGTTPLYVRYLGLEAYGLIGFFATLQAVISLLDLGLAPTVAREVARFRATGEPERAAALVRTLGWIYWGTAILIGILVVAFAPAIGRGWLDARALSETIMVQAVVLMGIIVALRWPAGLYMSVLMGAERADRAAVLSAGSTAAGSLVALAVVMTVAPTILAFFLCQTAVALGLTLLARRQAWGYLHSRVRPRFDAAELRRVWRFAAQVGAMGVLSVMLVLLDKLLLSRILPLEEFGRYVLAGIAGRLLVMLTGPVFSAIYPRFSALIAAQDEASARTLYIYGTRALAGLLFALAFYVTIFRFELFALWTGDPALAARVGWPAALIAVGTALNGVSIFSYAVQIASGRPRLPLIITIVLIVLYVPLLWVLAKEAGIAGGAAAWVVLNLIYLPLGIVLTDRYVLPRSGIAWTVTALLSPLAIAAAVVGGGGMAIRALGLVPLLSVSLGALLVPLMLFALYALTPIFRQATVPFRLPLRLRRSAPIHKPPGAGPAQNGIA